MSDADLPPIAILCGGLATRLGELTATCPKSMLPVAGVPFLAHQLRLLADSGFRRVVLLCGYLGEQIEEYAGDGARFGCQLSYSFDGDVLLGTGGAVRRALPLLGDEFLLIYGDSYCPTDLRRVLDAFRASKKDGLMTVFHNQNQWDRSNVEFRNGQIIRYDKTSNDNSMTYIDYGVNVFRCSAFERVGEGQAIDLAVLQQELLARGELAGVEVFERFYEIGSFDGLKSTAGLFSGSSPAGGTEA